MEQAKRLKQEILKKVEEYYKKYFVYSSCSESIIKTLV